MNAQLNNNIIVSELNFNDEADVNGFKFLLRHYSSDPMGGNSELNEDILKKNLIAMHEKPFAYSFIAKIQNDRHNLPIGLMNCFEGFSTFKARPLMNIHDFVVHENYRGLGVANLMLNFLENYCRKKQFCKLTLEVLEENHSAQAAYKKFGFKGYELMPQTGIALFWQKEIKYD